MVIPIADRNPTRRTPWVTRLLIATNIAVFVFLTPWWTGAPCAQVAFYQEWAVVPQEVVQAAPLTEAQAAGTPAGECDLAPTTDKNVWLSIVTSMFLHGGWVHLVLNMLYLAIFGNNVEDRFGHLTYLAFYLFSGAAATLAFVAANADEATSLVGASGAIAGVLGAYLVMFPRARVYASVPLLFFLVLPLPAAFVLILWFVGQVGALRVGDLAGGQVAYLAHVAGFVVGLGLTWFSGVRGAPPPVPHGRRRPPPSPRRRRRPPPPQW